MNIHEFQARQLLSRFGVATPNHRVVTRPEEAVAAAEELRASGASTLVVKSQIHAGGRGKGTFKSGFQGGVKLRQTASEVGDVAKAMLGQVLVTKQTGPDGRLVRKLLVGEAPKILKEYYVAVLLDRVTSRPVLMASAEGGVDIEEVAEKTPEKLVRESIDPALGLMPYQARRVALALGFRGELIANAAKLLLGVWRVSAVDAKIGLDDNALFRHPDIAAMRDEAEESPLEIEASHYGLNYIKLDGTIACLVNGAGLAMATMDIIKYYGGNPANFLDVGGGASREQVAAAFKIILKDPHVNAILVNIFGGIMDCDIIAKGIVAAVQETGLKLPLVVRLEGNNVLAGKQTLAQSGFTIVDGDTMADAAQKVVKAAGAARA